MRDFFFQIIRLPVTIFSSSMDMLAQTFRGAQSVTTSAETEGTVGRINRSFRETLTGRGEARDELWRPETEKPTRSNDDDGDDEDDDDHETHKEESKMRDNDSRDRDCDDDYSRDRDRDSDDRERRDRDRRYRTDSRDDDLRGDDLKLVRYKVLFVKRDYEVAFPEQEELISDDLSCSEFTAWKIAEFMQQLDETKIPHRWIEKAYPPDATGIMVEKLPEDDKKYLRVYHEVLARYEREKFHHRERQIEVLEEIRDVLKDK